VLVACLLPLSACSVHLTSAAGLRAAPTAPSGAAPDASAASSYDVEPADFTAVRRLLARRAAAVVHGDEAGFLATVDRARASFVAAQRVLFANLEKLPVTSMSYEVGTLVLTNAPGVTGGPLFSPEVVEHVFLAGTDERPVANDVNETFVKRSGRWLLAADTTDTSQPGTTARPWGGPPISVVTRGPLIVVCAASLPGGAARLADTVQRDIRFDAAILHVPVDDHLLVDATRTGTVSKFGNSESAGAVTYSATATRDFEPVGEAGLRIKVNPRYIDYLEAYPPLLRHEITHALMLRFNGRVPLWLSEGLADYVARQPLGLASEPLGRRTYDRLMKRPHDLMTSGLFGEDPETDYPLAMAYVTYLAEHGGIARLKELMRTYASYPPEPFEDSHTSQAIETVYGMTPRQVADGAFALLAALR
jgi:hypothetical protein